MVLTATGTLVIEVVPLPSWPELPAPQQYALSSEAIAQVCEVPAEICLIVLPANTPVVLTATGISELVVELLPRLPDLLFPQQYALLSEAIAQVCILLSDILLIIFPASTPSVLTATGILKLVVELLPRAPEILLPQQYALSSEATAHVLDIPAKTCLADINLSLFSTPTRIRKLAPACVSVAAVLSAANGAPGVALLDD